LELVRKTYIHKTMAVAAARVDKHALLDAMIEEYSSNQWRWSIDDTPDATEQKQEEIENAISIDVCTWRSLNSVANLRHMIEILFDINLDVDPAAIGRAIKEKRWEDVPAVIKSKTPLPEGAHMQLFFEKKDARWNILKHFIFPKDMKVRDVQPLLHGDGFALPAKHDTWGLRKGFQGLLKRIPGYAITYVRITRTNSVKPEGGKKDGGWNLSAEEIAAGIDFINNAPSVF
jgi:hypothetical protein